MRGAGATSFSHKRHATLKLPCVYCHADAERLERAGFPKVETCRTCHKKDADIGISSKRVYKLPHFVFFSHATHSEAKIECDGCHGKVYEMDAVRVERPLQ